MQKNDDVAPSLALLTRFFAVLHGALSFPYACEWKTLVEKSKNVEETR